MDASQKLKQHYPWIQTPLIVGAPMRLIALAEMAVEVSKAGGIGFIGAGTDISTLSQHLTHATHLLKAHTPLPTTHSTLPIGIGFINWGCPISPSISLITQFRPCAVWFFAPSSLSSLHAWVKSTRHASPATRIWVQVGSVHEAIQVTKLVRPHVLVIQGTDAGGHGLLRGASLLTLVPEVCDALQSESDFSTTTADQGPIILAAGGITDPRTAASCLLLGASGLVLGTRLLATPQAQIAPGYQRAVLAATDGGQTTVRTKVYDELRGTTGWAATHNARAIINQSYLDAVDNGMSDETNKKLYRHAEAMAAKANENHNLLWGFTGRLTTYAGTGVGLITEVKEAGDVVREIRHGAKDILERAGQKAKL